MLTPRKTPSGLHFLERNSGLNLLLEEVQFPPEEWAAAPRTLSVALTNACDSECPHCFAPKVPGVLRVDDVLRWARELHDNGGHGIGFGGGEPTLFPGLADVCRWIASRTALAVTLTTHGHRFTEELAASLRGTVHLIRVSVGGLYETYERVHKRPYYGLVSRLDTIRATAAVGVSYLVTEDTLRQLPEAAELAMEWGACELLILPLLSPHGDVLLPIRAQEALGQWIRDNCTRYPLSVSAEAAPVIDAPRLPIGDPRGCTYDFLHVDAQGRLAPSAFTGPRIDVASEGGLMGAVASLRQIHGRSSQTDVERRST